MGLLHFQATPMRRKHFLTGPFMPANERAPVVLSEDFDDIDRATEDAVDWVTRGHAYECLGGVELTLPKEGK